jgi:hypothetical protein
MISIETANIVIIPLFVTLPILLLSLEERIRLGSLSVLSIALMA